MSDAPLLVAEWLYRPAWLDTQVTYLCAVHLFRLLLSRTYADCPSDYTVCD